jgi:RNA polymerase sigma factor (sigma-70 family)
MTDIELVTAAKAGDQNAFAEIYKRYSPTVKWRIKNTMLTDDVEDLCQEVFIAAFAKLPQFASRSTFKTWITRIAMNECFMEIRKRKRLKRGDGLIVGIEDIGGDVASSSEDKSLTSAEIKIDSNRILEAATGDDRKLLKMSYLYGLSNQEIANRRNVSLACVRRELENAEARTREELNLPRRNGI